MNKLQIKPSPFRALSWKQPFASLMLHGKIETRTWPTKYRGLVLICASQIPYPANKVYSICGEKQWDRIIKMISDKELLLSTKLQGHAIATGNLVDCRPMQPSDEDACFVRYHPDLYCHIYTNIQPITPFPFKGKQGWTILTQSQINEIQLL
jgi:hypothetical protein